MTPTLRPPLALSALLLTGVLSTPGVAQEPEYPTAEETQIAEAAPLFASHEILPMTLTADFHTLAREDRSEEDQQERPAVLEWTNPDGTTGRQEIQIKTRGNFRLSRRNCDFPPLRLNVVKGDAEGTLFEEQDKIKVVSPCKLGQDYWQQYVLAEYLVYRMYNLLTPLSFRPRLAEITYVDSSGEDDTFTRFAFLLEDDSEMAKRNQGIKLDWPAAPINPVLMELHHAVLVEFFQYMIGNTDWSGARGHNTELFKFPNGRFSAVPFDFDFSGIIDARYATPDPSVGTRSVRDRRFWGFCPEQLNRRPEAYQTVIDLLQENKAEIYELWQTQEHLDPDRVKETLEYLDEFFEILSSPDRVQKEMLDECKRIGED